MEGLIALPDAFPDPLDFRPSRALPDLIQEKDDCLLCPGGVAAGRIVDAQVQFDNGGVHPMKAKNIDGSHIGRPKPA